MGKIRGVAFVIYIKTILTFDKISIHVWVFGVRRRSKYICEPLSQNTHLRDKAASFIVAHTTIYCKLLKSLVRDDSLGKILLRIFARVFRRLCYGGVLWVILADTTMAQCCSIKCIFYSLGLRTALRDPFILKL